MTKKPKKRPLIAVVDSWGGVEDIFEYHGCEAVPVSYYVSEVEAFKMVEAVDGIVFTGGSDIHPKHYGQHNIEASPGAPSRDEGELLIAKIARNRGVPMFGICRGHQLLNVAYGGTLFQHIDYTHNGSVSHGYAAEHRVKLSLHTAVGHALRKHIVEGTSIHHQAVDRVGDGLIAAGWTADGTIEVIESVDAPYVLGVQFHPEMTPTRPWAEALWYYWIGRVKQEMKPDGRPLYERINDLPATDIGHYGYSAYSGGHWERDGSVRTKGGNVFPIKKWVKESKEDPFRTSSRQRRRNWDDKYDDWDGYWWEKDDMSDLPTGHYGSENHEGWRNYLLADESAYRCGYDRPKAHGKANLESCYFPPCQYPEFCNPDEGDCYAMWHAKNGDT